MQLLKGDDLNMQIVHTPTDQERWRDRSARYRKTSKGRANEARTTARKRQIRANSIPEFIGVDSEGIGRGKAHRAVLLGVGREQYVATDIRRGLQWEEVFEFLYKQFEEHPRAAFVGFYLSYDFNQWLRSLPLKAARSLITKEGRAARRTKGQAKRRQYQSVKVGRWEVDMMGFKRLSIRPRPQNCTCFEDSHKCPHTQLPWMHVCDAGPFYQMPFIRVIDPKTWKDDPLGPVCSQEQFDRIQNGKNKRALFTRVTKEMKEYNVEENLLLAVVMDRLARGFAKVGIKLAKDQWYGPGAAASTWLRGKGAVKRKDLRQKDGSKPALMPRWFWDACQYSYFGGWFEIFSHGIIHGTSYNYDINNAYPYAATKLPHICDSCKYRRGQGTYTGSGAYVLMYATVFSANHRVGPLPHRNKQGAILRPQATKGWYWRHEIEASRRAGLVKKVMEYEWCEFVPCSHPDPFSEIEALYEERKRVGKDSAQGMAIKNNNNSIYGKFAQSVGGAPYNNWLYASLITSSCRIQILDAIATHPGGPDSLLMVATDGICFDSPHNSLPISKQLGEWSHSEYEELCLFKPGVYWHREGKDALLKVKSRGVPRDEFAKAIDVVEAQFEMVHNEGHFPGRKIESWALDTGRDIAEFRTEQGWPHFWVPVKFRMKSCATALNEGHWETAGQVQEMALLKQDSDPSSKRTRPRYNWDKRRVDTVIHSLPVNALQTKYHGEVQFPKKPDIGYGFDGSAISDILEAATILRDKPASYDLPLDEVEWERVW